jgi:hypothetical protein
MANVDIYQGRDPRDVPTYSIREAASYMRLPPTTLREWVSGPARVIHLAGGRPPLLSFWNLVEAYVLAALRRRHQVPLQRVRKALRFLERELDTERPLIEQEFLTDGLDLFVDYYGKLVNASRAGQTEIRSLLEASLERVERDPRGSPSACSRGRASPMSRARSSSIRVARSASLSSRGPGFPRRSSPSACARATRWSTWPRTIT